MEKLLNLLSLCPVSDTANSGPILTLSSYNSISYGRHYDGILKASIKTKMQNQV
eukprot:Gb_39594 [translate_table: standard]